jgi:hypothetical protein
MGRPFLVGGSERRAACSARADWRASDVAPDVRALTPSVRARLTEHWLGVGLMEHASIAAFARFALHLLALGAPPDLVLLSQQAMADEIEHTRLAFSLASAYAGAEIGPDALAIDGSLDGFTVAEILATLVREGCIGETVAALEAMEALDDVRDPAVRSVLERVASDELRHAELAWRTLSWLVASGRVSRSAAGRAVAAGLDALTEPPWPPHTAADNEDLSELGVFGAAHRERVRLAAASEVIAPCAAGLMTRHMRRTSDGARV